MELVRRAEHQHRKATLICMIWRRESMLVSGITIVRAAYEHHGYNVCQGGGKATSESAGDDRA